MTHKLDPELAKAASVFPNSDWSDPLALRASREAFEAEVKAQIRTDGVRIEERQLPGLNGEPDVTVRVYRPESAEGKLPGLLHFHGGGYVIGNLDSEHATSVAFARMGVYVLSVDYRLAPEHPYPAGLNDCYGALLWLAENAVAENVDRERIAVYGQSAGGGLAAAVALRARDENGPSLCFQFLGMPELDDRLQTVSMQQFSDTPVWTNGAAVKSWEYYLGAQLRRGGEDVPYLAAPARAQDLSNLPPAYVTAMEFDPLRDEDIEYGLRLLQAGVSTELHTFPGTYHGSALVVSAAISKRQTKEMFVVLKRAFGME